VQRVLRFVDGFTVAAAVLAALVCLIGIFQAVQSLFGAPDRFTAPNASLSGKPIHLRGGRGQEIDLYIVDDVSLAGLWASETGLKLSLASDETGFETSFEVVPPEEKDWDEDIATTSSTDHELEIPVSFTVPDAPGPEAQTLRGAITGDFLYPRSTGERTFDEVSTSLEIPVTLDVLNDEDAAAQVGATTGWHVRQLVARVLGLLAVFTFAITRARTLNPQPNEHRRRWELALRAVAGAGVWFVVAGVWLFPGLFGT
jgi:hypothetical protein